MKLDVVIFGRQRGRERRDDREAKGNEEWEQRENVRRERGKGVEMTISRGGGTSPLASACFFSFLKAPRYSSEDMSSRLDSAVKRCSSHVLVSSGAAW